MKTTLILLFLFVGCTPSNVSTYTYFRVDAVRPDGTYEILVKDPDPAYDQVPMLFPTGSVMVPESYERYIKIIYKTDSVWIAGDTLILQKK